jgi:hypothetical protein
LWPSFWKSSAMLFATFFRTLKTFAQSSAKMHARTSLRRAASCEARQLVALSRTLPSLARSGSGGLAALPPAAEKGTTLGDAGCRYVCTVWRATGHVRYGGRHALGVHRASPGCMGEVLTTLHSMAEESERTMAAPTTTAPSGASRLCSKTTLLADPFPNRAAVDGRPLCNAEAALVPAEAAALFSLALNPSAAGLADANAAFLCRSSNVICSIMKLH